MAAVLSIVVLGPACASYTRGLRHDDKYRPERAYVYGRFKIDVPSSTFGFAGFQTMGFFVRCRDGSSFTIRFSKHFSFQMFEVSPSVCQIDEFVYSDGDGRELGRGMATFRLLQNEFLKPGGVYYVGDFVAQADSYQSPGLIHYEWHVTSVRDNYADSTDALKRSYKYFADVKTENRVAATR